MLAAVILLGLVIGSFLNVVIARVPDRRSLWGRSSCAECGGTIAAYDNVPLLSFAVLRGRCRSCGVRIPWRYPLVELVTAALFGLAYLRFGMTAELWVATVFLSALVAITVIDLEHQIIPDVISVPGIGAGFAAAVLTRRISWLDSLIGIAVCGGIFFVIIIASGGGMGGGDMKLGAMLGAFLGWQVGLFALLVAVILGGLAAGALLLTGRKGRKDAIPFGPFIAVGGVIGLFLGVPDFLAGL